MVARRLSLYAVVAAACAFSFSCVHQAVAQNAAAPDQAAGRMVDSLFDPKVPDSLLPNKDAQLPPRRGIKRPTLQAKLVRNSNAKDGAPAYALVDRYGGILRYVEPVDKVKLDPYVGRIVKVRHDTGDTLLASQLIFPPLTRQTTSTGRPTSRVQQAAFQEPIPAGEPAEETLLEPTPANEPTPADEPEPATEGETYTFDEGEEVYMGEGAPVYEEGMEFSDCPDCVDGTCSLHMGPGGYRPGMRQPGPRSRAYLHGEYLLWWFDGMDTPPLVTASTDPDDGGVLPNFPGDNPTTVILYGGDPILEDPRHGFRVLLGVWLDENNKQAIEGEYLFLGRLEESFTASGEDGLDANGNPFVISRPFFDLTPDPDQDGVLDFSPREAAEQVSSDIIDGTVTVNSTSEFQGAGFRFRHNLCRSGCADIGCGSCVDCGMGIDCGLGVDCGYGVGCGSGVGCASQYRYVDFLAGFRWYQLNEELEIMEDLTADSDDADPGSLPGPGDPPLPPDGTRFVLLDQFRTDNDFFGAELGFDWGIERNRWSLELLSKLAIGGNSQKVTINGSTQEFPPNVNTPNEAEGALLALPTNIGEYERDRFSMIPELNFNVGYKLTQRCRLRVGYTIMYWTNVLRPGDQIDRELNSTQIPSSNAAVVLDIPARPQFTFNETNVLIQGLNIGAEYCW